MNEEDANDEAESAKEGDAGFSFDASIGEDTLKRKAHKKKKGKPKKKLGNNDQNQSQALENENCDIESSLQSLNRDDLSSIDISQQSVQIKPNLLITPQKPPIVSTSKSRSETNLMSSQAMSQSQGSSMFGDKLSENKRQQTASYVNNPASQSDNSMVFYDS